MKETPGRLSERLRVEGEKTLAFFQGLTPDQLDQVIYTENSQWKVHQILAHFVSAEAAFLDLLADITSGGEGSPVGFDINRFNESQVKTLQNSSFDELMKNFAKLRERTMKMVFRLPDDDLLRTGRHPFFGEVALEDMIKLIYRHNQIHLRDIRRVTHSGS